MLVKSLKKFEEIKDDVSSLYLSAFPVNERPPLDYFYHSIYLYEENNLYAFYDKNEFIGFTYLTIYQDVCYIFFLAVAPSKRNQGYGSQILSCIKENNKDKVLLLCYEEVDKKYLDYETRVKRKAFYEANGFKPNGLRTNEYGVIFETGYIGTHPVDFDTYKEIFKLGFGNGSEKYLKEEN